MRQLDAHGFEISGRDPAPVGGDTFPRLLRGGVVCIWGLRAAAAQRQAIDDSHRLDAGNLSHGDLQLLCEFDHIFEFLVAVARNIQPHRQDVVGIVAGSRVFQTIEAANQEPSTQ